MDSAGRSTEIDGTRESGHLLLPSFQLHVLSPDSARRSHTSDGPRLVIGASRSADLVLADSTASRFHCEILVEGLQALVHDLGSRNGTYVDGVRVREAILHPGAILRLGGTEIRFEPVSDAVRWPIPERHAFGAMVARSPAMRAVFAVLERAATADITVLIEGETGTGKGLIAETLHEESARRAAPFVVVDCGGLPAELLESELFGHCKGAFTGAHEERVGAFEAAQGGTLFLDEIGELPLDLQPKLLRAIEGRQVKRIGENQYRQLDVRVLAATNRDLRTEVNAGSFRADLYYRLAVVNVRVPPLRERREDIMLTAQSLLARLCEKENLPPEVDLGNRAFADLLTRQRWLGNVRELRNYLEQCLVLGPSSPAIGAEPDAPRPKVDVDRPLRQSREAWVSSFEREYLIGLLERHHGNVSAAARSAGVARVYLHRLIRRYRLR